MKPEQEYSHTNDSIATLAATVTKRLLERAGLGVYDIFDEEIRTPSDWYMHVASTLGQPQDVRAKAYRQLTGSMPAPGDPLYPHIEEILPDAAVVAAMHKTCASRLGLPVTQEKHTKEEVAEWHETLDMVIDRADTLVDSKGNPVAGEVELLRAAYRGGTYASVIKEHNGMRVWGIVIPEDSKVGNIAGKTQGYAGHLLLITNRNKNAEITEKVFSSPYLLRTYLKLYVGKVSAEHLSVLQDHISKSVKRKRDTADIAIDIAEHRIPRTIFELMHAAAAQQPVRVRMFYPANGQESAMDFRIRYVPQQEGIAVSWGEYQILMRWDEWTANPYIIPMMGSTCGLLERDKKEYAVKMGEFLLGSIRLMDAKGYLARGADAPRILKERVDRVMAAPTLSAFYEDVWEITHSDVTFMVLDAVAGIPDGFSVQEGTLQPQSARFPQDRRRPGR